MNRLLLVGALAGGLVFQSDAALPSHTNDFESGTTEGWDGTPPTNQPSDGPMGAGDNFLQVDAHGNNGPGSRAATYNEASEWIGDYAAAGITAVNVDLMVPQNSPSLEMRFVLFGPETTRNRWTSTNAAMVANDGIWRNYEFSLAEADLTFVPFNPSSATYSDLMSDVIRVMLRHDAGTPSARGDTIEATVGIDNVTLVAALAGDFDGSQVVDAADIDMLTTAIREGSTDLEFDLDDSATVDGDDVTYMIETILGTHFGDADLNGSVTASGDGAILLANLGGVQGNKGWADADFDGDQNVTASADGGVLLANLGNDAATVPEPEALLLVVGMLTSFACCRRERECCQAS